MRSRRIFSSFVLMSGLLLFTGCQDKINAMPDQPIIFQTGELSAEDADTGYATIEYDGRIYIMYGSIKSKGLFGDLTYAFGDCLGYTEDDPAARIYALANAPTDEWLIEYYIDGVMENPVVLREIGTKNNPDTPESVESLEYDYWK